MHVADLGEVIAVDDPHRVGAGAGVVGVGLEQANLLGDGFGGEAVVAGDHRHLDAALAAALDGLGDLGAGWVVEANQAHKGQRTLQLLGGLGGPGLSLPSHGHPQHAIPPTGQGIVGVDQVVAHRLIQVDGACVGGELGAQAHHFQGGPLGDHQGT